LFFLLFFCSFLQKSAIHFQTIIIKFLNVFVWQDNANEKYIHNSEHKKINDVTLNHFQAEKIESNSQMNDCFISLNFRAKANTNKAIIF